MSITITEDHLLYKKNDLLETKATLSQGDVSAKSFCYIKIQLMCQVLTMSVSYRITPKLSSTHTTNIKLIRNNLFTIKKLHNFNPSNSNFKFFFKGTLMQI